MIFISGEFSLPLVPDLEGEIFLGSPEMCIKVLPEYVLAKSANFSYLLP